MECVNYKPFSGPREFSELMRALFHMYWSETPDLISFGWLQKTLDLEVVCKDSTKEEVGIPTHQVLNELSGNVRGSTPQIPWISSARPPTIVGLVGWD
ncbi:hypothetical protein ACJ73_04301 [Blastomyces percursus]|uniref:Uncharacterized protein n=1 Tax=Blastomyces percursus TaxID=1658174 RepID=A0A1J9R9J7_9EURO|nr:hypothetical protein ACJ73_04301 [Blastomyces percursus]